MSDERLGGMSMSEVESKEIVDIELTEEQLDCILDELDDVENIDDVEDVLFENRVIYLSGAVDNDMSANIIPLIHYYNIQDEQNNISSELRSPIKIFIDSEGGELYRGFNLLSSIERSETPIWTYLEGSIGMSMSLILFLSGTRRFMSRFGNLMYHELRAGSDVSTLAEMKNTVNHYERLQDKMDKYIVERTSIPLKKLKEQRKKNLDWFIDYDIAKKYDVFTDTI
jgi:ATP-dependent Clp protease protease subunit